MCIAGKSGYHEVFPYEIETKYDHQQYGLGTYRCRIFII